MSVRIQQARFLLPAIMCGFLCLAFLVVAPAAAFTADSLNITVGTNGDATAVFQFTLDGVIENAIPQSILENQLVQGLATGASQTQIISFNNSEATLLLKNFATTNDVPTGTEYQTASMNFTKAQIALQNSAVSTVISADFSPEITTVTFPDGYSRQFFSSSVLPSLDHIVVNPGQSGTSAGTPAYGSLEVNTTPEHTHVYIDSIYVGDSPGMFPEITPGNHLVSLQADGFIPLNTTVNVKAGNITQLFGDLDFATTPTKKSVAPDAGMIIAMLSFAFCGMSFLYRK
ncbi:MAG: PEGA domain-containing protein [Methanoregula sp.]|uniref:PEGA domain-containing protein n=1 Tax=Methanoregula sp. TaxID=2052170 RepID=UPI003BB03DA1